ncbi:type II secretion system F family protein [Candidatus Woesearchaeota archaeon]|nr:type II secretion system F family protein [Candidatus Woesearchaeota archaeon]
MVKISFFIYLTKKFPQLPENLKKAGMHTAPEEFTRKTFISALYTSFALLFIMFMLMANFLEALTTFLVLLGAFPVLLTILFFYFYQVPVLKINKIDREISKEIIFAGRFLMVELESGVSLYDAMKNLSKNYPVVGAYFREIIDKINIGTPIEDAVAESIDLSPSASLTKILWQVSNSLRTGSDIAAPLKTVIENMIKEQQIAVNEYARKLNPLAMFYMMMAVIMPSLGVTMLTIVSIFVGLQLNLIIFMVIAVVIGFVQFMFVAMINSIRPPVEL